MKTRYSLPEEQQVLIQNISKNDHNLIEITISFSHCTNTAIVESLSTIATVFQANEHVSNFTILGNVDIQEDDGSSWLEKRKDMFIKQIYSKCTENKETASKNTTPSLSSSFP